MSNENRGQPKRVNVPLSLYELDYIMEALTEEVDITLFLRLLAYKEELEKKDGNK